MHMMANVPCKKNLVACPQAHFYSFQFILLLANKGITSYIIKLNGDKVSALLQARQTAFHLAARKGHLRCLQLLLVAARCSQSLDSLLRVDKVSLYCLGFVLGCRSFRMDGI